MTALSTAWLLIGGICAVVFGLILLAEERQKPKATQYGGGDLVGAALAYIVFIAPFVVVIGPIILVGLAYLWYANRYLSRAFW